MYVYQRIHTVFLFSITSNEPLIVLIFPRVIRTLIHTSIRTLEPSAMGKQTNEPANKRSIISLITNSHGADQTGYYGRDCVSFVLPASFFSVPSSLIVLFFLSTQSLSAGSFSGGKKRMEWCFLPDTHKDEKNEEKTKHSTKKLIVPMAAS